MFFGQDTKGMKVTTAQSIAQNESFPDGLKALSTDVVIVGSGSGGSIAAYRLALAGYRVVVLDAGRYVPESQIRSGTNSIYSQAYSNSGLQFNERADVNILQGSCIGGSSAVGDSLSMRMPKEVLEQWHEETGLDIFKPENMESHYSEVERQLRVKKAPTSEIDSNSLKAIQGAEAMQLNWDVAKRCAINSTRKVSSIISYLPWSLTAQASIYADTFVTKVNIQNGRAVGVDAMVIDPDDGSKVVDLRIDAPLVILAAGAIQTPQILQRSNVTDFSELLGKNLSLNPYASVVGEYDTPVDGWEGIDVGMVVDNNLSLRYGGNLLVPQMHQPASLLMQNRLTPAYQQAMLKSFRNLANINAYVMDNNTGSVQWNDSDEALGKSAVSWQLDRKAFRNLKSSVAQAARIHFSAGAKRVYLPTFQRGMVDSVFQLDSELAAFKEDDYHFAMQSVAPQGTCRMHSEAGKGVVNRIGEVYNVKGIFVNDASILPSCTNVMPELTIYALSSYICDEIIKRDKDYFLPLNT